MTQYLPFLGTSFDDASDDDRKSRSELLVEIQRKKYMMTM